MIRLSHPMVPVRVPVPVPVPVLIPGAPSPLPLRAWGPSPSSTGAAFLLQGHRAPRTPLRPAPPRAHQPWRAAAAGRSGGRRGGGEGGGAREAEPDRSEDIDAGGAVVQT